MLLFLLFVLVCCAVKCDYVSNNYYIIEMPEAEIARDYNTPFKVYWNVPTKQCKSRNVMFDNLDKFGIIQNQNDSFEGGRITIMYDPGVFPAIFKGDSGNYRYRNGGVPQQGNLELHLTVFRESLNKSMPNPDFSGVGIIDFESWRPIFRQQFGSLTPYIDLSMNIERRRHWWWPTSWQKMEATKRFEDAARVFMQTTLSIAKQMRPRATWGYYAYPYCYNMGTNNMVENCSDVIKGENDKIYWLWAESTALYPSVYSSANLSTSQLAALVRGRVTEANRVKKAGTLVLPYFWFRYRDAGFMKETDVIAVFEALKRTNASGLIIWGSSNDVNQGDKCNELYNYVETTLGPIIKKYIQQINNINNNVKQVDPENDDDYNDTPVSTTDATTTVQANLNESAETTASDFLNETVDSDFVLSPQNNYTENTSQNELSESNNKTDDNNIYSKTLNESSFWDIVQNQFNIEKDSSKQTTRSIQNIDSYESLENNNKESYFENTKTPDDKISFNMDVSTTETTLQENILTNVLDTKSEEFLIIENTTYPNSETSTDNIGNINFNHETNEWIPLSVNLIPPVTASANTNDDYTVENFTQTSTDSSENFIIISDDQKDDSGTSAINVT